LSLITNDEVLAVNQDPLGRPARRAVQTKGTEIWVKQLKDGSQAIGLFNRSTAAQDVELAWSDVGLTGKQKLRDVRLHKDFGVMKERYTSRIPAHGAVLLRVSNGNGSDE
jgi:alpha-galactosidase